MLHKLAVSFALAACARAQAVATSQYDNQRTGATSAETTLTPRNVNSARFGTLMAVPVDGDVFAQPLYLPNLEVPGKGRHDVVFVASEHDSVYAIDATGAAAVVLWHISFINPAAGVTPVAEQDVRCPFISPDIGITSTPVIDEASRTLYVLVRTAETDRDGTKRFYQRLHALDAATGLEKPGSPVLIRASVPVTSLFGLFSSPVNFHALLENPRAALLIASGNVYLSWASSCDVGPYHGWVLAYDARTLKQTGVFNTSPDSSESGIWQSDAGIASDAGGAVYAITGNGKFDASRGGRDYGDSVIKLGFANGALAIRDYFTPFDEERLKSTDGDLGSGGPVLLPNQAGPHPHLLVAAGKGGLVYVIDRDHMGGFHAGSNAHAIQTFKTGTGVYGATAYWNGHLYVASSSDTLKDFRVESGRIDPAAAHQGNLSFSHGGAIPTVSANGSKDGIVWLVGSRGPNRQGGDSDAILHAYDATDVSRELYAAVLGPSVRFAIPTVAGGRVYVGARRALYVLGLRDRSGHSQR
jgi:hypothetical protein